MNKCYVMCEIVSDIDYSFLLREEYTSLAKFKGKLSNGAIIDIEAFDYNADYLYSHDLKNILVEGFIITEGIIVAQSIEKIPACKKEYFQRNDLELETFLNNYNKEKCSKMMRDYNRSSKDVTKKKRVKKRIYVKGGQKRIPELLKIWREFLDEGEKRTKENKKKNQQD